MKLRVGFVSNSSSSSFVMFPAVTEQKVPIKVLFTNDGKKIPEQQNGQEGTYKIKTFG